MIIALCSKTYIAVDDSKKMKISAKGINHASLRANNPLERFRSVLETAKPESGVNKGFRAMQGQVYTYAQQKQCLPYFYCKRYVHDDGIFTSTLQVILRPVPKKYLSLQTDAAELSPDYKRSFTVDNVTYDTIRQAIIYQKQQTSDACDAEKLDNVLKCTDTYQLKRLAKAIPTSSTWRRQYQARVEKILTQRINQNADFKNILVGTKNEKLLNTDESDKFGGNGNSAETTRWCNNMHESGRNIIGEVYMKIRDEYKMAMTATER